MKDLIKNILAIGVTIGLSNREAFVEKMSAVISEYQEDPDRAEKWANILTQYIENTRNNYQMQQVIESAMAGSNMPDKKNLEDLTSAIKRLTQALEEKKGK